MVMMIFIFILFYFVSMQGMWPYYNGHYQSHELFWPLDRNEDDLLQLANVNHEDCHFKFHDQS